MANRADQRKYHYIYKITRNDGSGKYYIGMHSTDDLEDGYFGSGQLLWKSIKKHGKEQHSKEILEYFSSREALKLRERELVNEEILDDPLCMNLKLGGEGGGRFLSEDHRLKCSKASAEYWKNNSKSLEHQAKITKALTGNSKCFVNSPRFAGRLHSEETKQKMRKPKNIGEANSQFGTCWVTKDSKPIKIKKEQLDEYLANGYSRGRK